MKPLPVNEAINQAHHLSEACIAIEGILTFEAENVSICHWPKAERKEGYASSIWIDPDGAVFSFDERTMVKWSAKRVVVLGVIESSKESGFEGGGSGYGHFGLWPVRIRARRIDLLKRWLREHPEIKDAEQISGGNGDRLAS